MGTMLDSRTKTCMAAGRKWFHVVRLLGGFSGSASVLGPTQVIGPGQKTTHAVQYCLSEESPPDSRCARRDAAQDKASGLAGAYDPWECECGSGWPGQRRPP